MILPSSLESRVRNITGKQEYEEPDSFKKNRLSLWPCRLASEAFSEGLQEGVCPPPSAYSAGQPFAVTLHCSGSHLLHAICRAGDTGGTLLFIHRKERMKEKKKKVLCSSPLSLMSLRFISDSS